MNLRVRETGKIINENEFKLMFSNVSFPEILSEQIFDDFGVDIIFEGAQPIPENSLQYVQQSGIEQINGKWFTKYILYPTFVEYTDKNNITHTVEEQMTVYTNRKTEEKAKTVRIRRDQLLKETDWRFRSDLIPSQDWKDYCQALRDITIQEGFPWNITWPIRPK